MGACVCVCKSCVCVSREPEGMRLTLQSHSVTQTRLCKSTARERLSCDGMCRGASECHVMERAGERASVT